MDFGISFWRGKVTGCHSAQSAPGAIHRGTPVIKVTSIFEGVNIKETGNDLGLGTFS